MKEPLDPPRLRALAAPASALATGLSAARAREPNDAQLRALEAALTASLGAALTGAAVAAVEKAAAATGRPFASAAGSAAGFKLTAAFVALLAAGGAAAYRQARRAPASMHARDVVVPPAAQPAPAPVASAPPAAAPALDHPQALDAAPRARHRAIPADQLALIARAQRTLSSDPGAALALVEDNRRALAQSAFAQEADVIAVAALVRLGRTDEARTRADRFVARFPDSVHAARMRRIAAIIK